MQYEIKKVIMITKSTAIFIGTANWATNNLSKIFLRGLASLMSDSFPSIDNTFHQKSVRVCILGGDTPVGEVTAFLLKQNPIVSQIYMYGGDEVRGIAADLKHIDTRSEVTAYVGQQGLENAIKRADIILMVGTDKDPSNATAETKLRVEARRVTELAEACAKHGPKSILAVCVNPVSSTLPLVSEIFKRTPWYHPARIIGSVALVQVKANSLVARFQDLDPFSVHVPLIGGPDIDTIVPLFSRATPVSILSSDCPTLQERIRNAEVESPIKTVGKPCKLIISPLSEAYGINHLVTTIGIGLCGDANAICAAFVRQNIIKGVRHLVCTIKFGPGGIVHNYGVPRLTGCELKLLERSVLELNKREQMALNLLGQMAKHKGSNQNLASMIELSPHVSQPKRD